jgi:hypothetical protein
MENRNAKHVLSGLLIQVRGHSIKERNWGERMKEKDGGVIFNCDML